MKFIFSTLFIALMAINIGFTQHIYFRTASIPGIDSNFYLDEVFEDIITSPYITTGLLWDKAFPHTGFQSYSGVETNEEPIMPDEILQAYYPAG
jgi:hypothetical protein